MQKNNHSFQSATGDKNGGTSLEIQLWQMRSWTLLCTLLIELNSEEKVLKKSKIVKTVSYDRQNRRGGQYGALLGSISP